MQQSLICLAQHGPGFFLMPPHPFKSGCPAFERKCWSAVRAQGTQQHSKPETVRIILIPHQLLKGARRGMAGLCLIAEASNHGEWIGEDLGGQSLRELIVLIGQQGTGPCGFTYPAGADHQAAIQLQGFAVGPGQKKLLSRQEGGGIGRQAGLDRCSNRVVIQNGLLSCHGSAPQTASRLSIKGPNTNWIWFASEAASRSCREPMAAKP